MFRYLNPKSRQNDSPKPTNIAQGTILLHTLGVQVEVMIVHCVTLERFSSPGMIWVLLINADLEAMFSHTDSDRATGCYSNQNPESEFRV